MIRNDEDLIQGLRALAGASPGEAPPELEARLTVAFRREARKRKLIRWIPAGVAVAAVAAALVVMSSPIQKDPGRPAAATFAVRPPEPIVSSVKRPSGARKPRPRRPAPLDEVATGFFALPQARDLPPVEAETMMRVQLPRSAMRLVGLPVNEERANERIRADMVFGQDGVARAVRFVQ